MPTWLFSDYVNLSHLGNAVFARFLHCKVHSSPLPLEARYIQRSNAASWGRCVCITYLNFFCIGDLFGVPHLLVYLITHRNMDGFMEILKDNLCYNLFLYFLCCSNGSSFCHWEFFQIGCYVPFIIPLKKKLFEHFFTFDHYKIDALGCIFYAPVFSFFFLYFPCLCSQISHFYKETWFLYWRVVLEMSVWILGKFTVTGWYCFQAFSEQS